MQSLSFFLKLIFIHLCFTKENKNMLQILERAWLLAATAALLVAIYYLVTTQAFNHFVYFPLFCCAFCVFLFFNVRSQRKFKETIEKEKQAVK
jgi:uncharacterized membrane protein